MIDLEKLREVMIGLRDQDYNHSASPGEVLELLDHIAALEDEVKEQCRINGMGSEREAALLSKVAQLEKDAGRLDWLDKQVKDHVVYNGYTWQEAGYEDNRGLVCAIQGKKQKLSVRQAIDTAMESKYG